jgi:hypothetical protein
MPRLRVSLMGNNVAGHAVNNDCETTPRLMRISTQRIQANKDGEETYMISIYTPPPNDVSPVMLIISCTWYLFLLINLDTQYFIVDCYLRRENI